MTELLAILAPILLTDIINPVLFAFMVYAVGSSHPVRNSTALLLGHTAAYLMAGIMLALGLEKLEHRLANPEPVDFAIELIVALLLLWIAIRSRSHTDAPPDTGTRELTFLSAFFLGAVVNFAGIPFAIPYFAALSQIIKADISAIEALIALAGYNIIYALPYATVPVLRALLGERSQALFEKINQLFDKTGSFILPALLLLLGSAMLVDALYYFVKGRALF